MKNREPIWWIPLARRILGWGAASSLMAGLLPLLVVAVLLSVMDVFIGPYQDPSYIPPTFWKGISSVVGISILASSPFLIVGLIFGATLGFYAPATEPKNPLKSKFFRGVGSQTLTFWALTSSALYTTFYYVFPYFGLKTPVGAVLVFSFILLCLSLWRAINRALAVTKLK